MLAFIRALAMMNSLAHGLMMVPKEKQGPTIALVHAYYAEAAATNEVPAPLLLAIAYKESRFQPRARPQCGITQVATRSRARCRRLVADPAYAYQAAAEHLGAWLAFCKGRGMPCALTGYGKGTKAARGKPSRYALHTLRLARRLADG